jgi:hypothetical protein
MKKTCFLITLGLFSYSIGFAFPFEKKQEQSQENDRKPHPYVQRLTLSHVEGINAYTGYGTNYSSATCFLSPNYKLGHLLPFLDGRVHRFDNNTYGANVGIGARYIPKPNTFCQLLGINAYYDYRRGHNWNYNQLGLGVEILGKRLDLRANMYIPFGIKKYSQCCVYDDYIGGWFAQNCKCESVSYGYNAEIGYLFLRSSTFLFYAATGPYYFSSKCLDKTIGWEVRVRPQYKDYFAIDFKVNYDQLYRFVYQTTFIVSLPLYQMATRKNHQGPCGITDRQIYQPVIRLETMPISRFSCWQTNFDDPDPSSSNDDADTTSEENLSNINPELENFSEDDFFE